MVQKKKTGVYALGQNISMSAHKARRVIDQIRGCSCWKYFYKTGTLIDKIIKN